MAIAKTRSLRATSPPVVVSLPGALVRLFPGACGAWSCRPRRCGEMIDALDARWPGMRDRLCDSPPRIRRHINIFVAGGARPWRPA